MNYEVLYNKILRDLNSKKVTVGKSGALAFSSKPNTKMETIWNIFGNKDSIPQEFKINYHEATSGKGFERRRITQLNSSSLLALLCFWNINSHPIIINNKEYNRIYFETENKVFNNPSSIDIFLISSDNSTWLFLESKFTEPLNPSNYYWIGEKYYSLYQTIVNTSNLPLTISELIERKTKNKEISKEFKLRYAKDQKEYLGGIKQMISHLIGIIQGFAKNEFEEMLIIPKNIILGTILYEFTINKDEMMYKHYQNYTLFYKEIFSKKNTKEIINIIANNKNICVNQDLQKISVLDTPLTYQEIFSDIRNKNCLLPKVKYFYNL